MPHGLRRALSRKVFEIRINTGFVEVIRLCAKRADTWINDEIIQSYLGWRTQFLDDDGALKPRYAPPPMVASFMQEPGAAQREQIPVPKGPVEVW